MVVIGWNNNENPLSTPPSTSHVLHLNMGTPLLSIHLLRKPHSSLMGFFITMTVLGFVCCLAAIFMGPAGPPGLLDTFPYSLGTGLLFSALSCWIYFSKRFRLDIHRKDKQVTLRIHDPTLPSIWEIPAPFTLYPIWSYLDLSRDRKMKLICLTLLDRQGEAIVSFEGTLGSAIEAPPGFTYVDTTTPGGQAKWKVASRSYSTSKVRTLYAALTDAMVNVGR